MGCGETLMSSDPPPRALRIITLMATAALVVWWLVLLAFAFLAREFHTAAEMDFPVAALVAPPVAIVTAIGLFVWLLRERVSSVPIITATIFAAVTLAIWSSVYSPLLFITGFMILGG